MISQSVCVLDFNIASETSALQKWIFCFLDSPVELIIILCCLMQR